MKEKDRLSRPLRHLATAFITNKALQARDETEQRESYRVNVKHLPLPLLHLVVVQDAFGRLARRRRGGGLLLCFSLAVVDAPVVVGRCVGRPEMLSLHLW